MDSGRKLNASDLLDDAALMETILTDPRGVARLRDVAQRRVTAAETAGDFDEHARWCRIEQVLLWLQEAIRPGNTRQRRSRYVVAERHVEPTKRGLDGAAKMIPIRASDGRPHHFRLLLGSQFRIAGEPGAPEGIRAYVAGNRECVGGTAATPAAAKEVFRQHGGGEPLWVLAVDEEDAEGVLSGFVVDEVSTIKPHERPPGTPTPPTAVRTAAAQSPVRNGSSHTP